MKTKESILRKNKVNLFIIKNGLLLSESSDICKLDKIDEKQISEKEMQIFKLFSSNKKENINLENIYKCIADNDFTVIRIYNNCDIFIGKKVKEIDKEEILKTLKEIENSREIRKIKNFNIYNRIDTEYGKEFENISAENIEQMQSKVEILLNEKLDCLTKEEQKIIKEYRTFDIKKLLTNKNINLINNLNSGVLLISPKSIVSSTLRKNNNYEQIESIIKNKYYNKYLTKDYDTTNSLINNILVDFNCIIIEILKQKEIRIYTPKNINTFQYENLMNIAKIIKNIQNKNNEITVYENKKIVEINDFIKYLVINKKSLIDSKIKETRNTSEPSSRKISNIEIELIFGIRKANTVGESIKRELEEYAINGFILKGNAENKIFKEITKKNIKKLGLYEIISKMEKEYINKLPSDLWNIISQNKNEKFDYNPQKKLREQNVKVETIELLSYINLKYWCNKQDSEELEYIYNRNQREDNINNGDIFENLQSKQTNARIDQNPEQKNKEETSIKVIEKCGIWKKLKEIYKILNDKLLKQPKNS